MPSSGLVFSDLFLDQGIPRDVVADPWEAGRLQVVWTAIRDALPEAPLIEPRYATSEELGLVHDPAYIELIRDYSSGARRREDYRHVSAETAITSNTFALASLAVGGVLAAVDAVEKGEVSNALVVARPGDHHAYPARGEGFCIFNHTAIGARYVQQAYGRGQVMILDWDVHHGNGTQAIFNSDPTVVTFSIHSFGAIYPRSGASTSRGSGPGLGTAINVPVEARTTDRRFREEFLGGLKRVRRPPEFLFVVAGFDGHHDDPIGDLRLSGETFDWLTNKTVSLAQDWCEGRLVSVLGGGYNLATLGTLAAAHARGLAAAS